MLLLVQGGCHGDGGCHISLGFIDHLDQCAVDILNQIKSIIFGEQTKKLNARIISTTFLGDSLNRLDGVTAVNHWGCHQCPQITVL